MAQDGLSSPQKFVLVVLADAANEDEGTCWLKHNTIAERTALGVTTVRDALRFLIAEGFIRVGVRYDKQGRQTSNLYQLGCYESVAEGVASRHPEGDGSRQEEVSAPDRSIVNQPEATDQPTKKKTSSPSSSRTRSARPSRDDGPDTSKVDAVMAELRPGTRPTPQTRRVSRGPRPTEHIHHPQQRSAHGLACYWAVALEQHGSLERDEEAIVGKHFKRWLERDLDVDIARQMVDLFFADPETRDSTHRWKRFVANSEALRQRVTKRNASGGGPQSDEETDWFDKLPESVRKAVGEG